MEIVLIVLLVIGLVKLFSSKKEKTPEEKKADQQQLLQKRYNALDKHPNPNQEELIATVFSIAEKNGGLWHVCFNSTSVTIDYKDRTSKLFSLSQLGYSDLNLHKHLEGETFLEFPFRLKRAAERRGYLYWTHYRQGYAKGSTYTSYDGGNSFSRDDSTGTFLSSVCVCSKEYYQLYHPYDDPDTPKQPSKKL